MKIRTALHIGGFGASNAGGIHALTPSAILFIDKIIKTIKSVGYTYAGQKSVLPSNDASKKFFDAANGIDQSALQNAQNGQAFSLYAAPGTSHGQSAMSAYYKLPGSDLLLCLEILTWMTSGNNNAEYLAISVTNDVNDSKRTYRYLWPLRHVGFLDDNYQINASDFGGLTIVLNRGSTKRSGMFMEPVYGLASAAPDGVALGSIGDPFFASVSSGDGITASLSHRVETAKLLAAIGEIASWTDPSQIGSSVSSTGKLGYPSAVSIMAWNGGGAYDAVIGCFDVLRRPTASGYTSPSKMFYTGTQGERVVIPNGPMLYTALYSSQRLRMICLMSKSAVGPGEAVTVVNPISDTEVEQFTYNFKNFTSDLSAELNTMIVGTLDGDVG